MRPGHVVIVGARPAGVMAARMLSSGEAPCRVTLVTNDSHHDLGLSDDYPLDMVTPESCLLLTDVLPGRVVLETSEIASLHLREKQIEFQSHRTLPYDYLVLDGVRAPKIARDARYQGFTFTPQYRSERQRLRAAFWRVIDQLRDMPHARLQLEVIGANRRGVQLALMFAQLRNQLVRRGTVSPTQISVTISEQAERVLPGCGLHEQLAAESALVGAGVTIQAGRLITSQQLDAWRMIRDPFVYSLVIWMSSGARTSTLLDEGLARDQRGRLLVDGHLRLIDYPMIWAVGDIGSQGERRRALDGLDQGRCVARNIAHTIAGTPLRTYESRGQRGPLSRARYQLALGLRTAFRQPCVACQTLSAATPFVAGTFNSR